MQRSLMILASVSIAKERSMVRKGKDYPALIKIVREQLDLSQEDLAREIGVSYATVNRWENSQTTPSKLAKANLGAFCVEMVRQGKLKLPPELYNRLGDRVGR